MIESVPKTVFYISAGGAVLPEPSLVDRLMIFRVFETKEEADTAACVAATFESTAKSEKAPLKDILTSVKTETRPIRLVLCGYDALGRLFDIEVLHEPGVGIQ